MGKKRTRKARKVTGGSGRGQGRNQPSTSQPKTVGQTDPLLKDFLNATKPGATINDWKKYAKHSRDKKQAGSS